MHDLSKVITMTCMLLTGIFPGPEPEIPIETEYEIVEVVETEAETEQPPLQVCEVIQPVISSQVIEPSYDIYTEEEIVSKSVNSPYIGMEFYGFPICTILGDKIIYKK